MSSEMRWEVSGLNGESEIVGAGGDWRAAQPMSNAVVRARRLAFIMHCLLAAETARHVPHTNTTLVHAAATRSTGVGARLPSSSCKSEPSPPIRVQKSPGGYIRRNAARALHEDSWPAPSALVPDSSDEDR